MAIIACSEDPVCFAQIEQKQTCMSPDMSASASSTKSTQDATVSTAAPSNAVYKTSMANRRTTSQRGFKQSSETTETSTARRSSDLNTVTRDYNNARVTGHSTSLRSMVTDHITSTTGSQHPQTTLKESTKINDVITTTNNDINAQTNDIITTTHRVTTATDDVITTTDDVIKDTLTSSVLTVTSTEIPLIPAHSFQTPHSENITTTTTAPAAGSSTATTGSSSSTAGSSLSTSPHRGSIASGGDQETSISVTLPIYCASSHYII